jgi:hypothetical protein
MIRILLATSAALLSQSALAQSVEVAEGDWSDIPAASNTGGPAYISERFMGQIDKLLAAGKCPSVGNRKYANLNVPILVQFDGGDQVQKIVVRRIGCPEVESIVGGIAAGRAKQGYYKSTGKNQTGWYRSEISYSVN